MTNTDEKLTSSIHTEPPCSGSPVPFFKLGKGTLLPSRHSPLVGCMTWLGLSPCPHALARCPCIVLTLHNVCVTPVNRCCSQGGINIGWASQGIGRIGWVRKEEIPAKKARGIYSNKSGLTKAKGAPEESGNEIGRFGWGMIMEGPKHQAKEFILDPVVAEHCLGTSPSVMVKFMCQLEWSSGHPD